MRLLPLFLLACTTLASAGEPVTAPDKPGFDATLAQHAFIADDTFTIADAYAFTILRWAPMLGISLKPYPHVDAYLQRIATRPAVHAALLAEGLVKA